MSLAQYDAAPQPKAVRAYFSTASATRKGQVVCLDTSASATDAVVQQRLGTQVVDCAASANNILFHAGVVSDASVAKTGPTFIEILQPAPGEVVQAEVDGTTAVAVGDPLKVDNVKGALIKDAAVAPGQTVYRALQAQAVASKVVILVQKI